MKFISQATKLEVSDFYHQQFKSWIHFDIPQLLVYDGSVLSQHDNLRVGQDCLVFIILGILH